MRRPGPIVTRSVSASVASRPTPHCAAVPPLAVATSRPTPQFTRHHDVAAPQVDSTAFRQGWLAVSRLDSLLAASRISREEWEAACRWRAWAHTITPCRQQQWDVRVDISAVPSDAGMLLRVNAATKLREASEALGELRVRLLEACVLHDYSWRQLAAVLQTSDKTAITYTVEALAALTAFLAGEPVPPAARLRYRHNGIGAR